MKVAAFRADSAGVSWYRMLRPIGMAAKQGLLSYAPEDMAVQSVFGKDGIRKDLLDAQEKIARESDVICAQIMPDFERHAIVRGLALVTGKPWIVEEDDDILHLERDNPAWSLYRPKSIDECYDVRIVKSTDELREGESCWRNAETNELLAVKIKDADRHTAMMDQVVSADAMFVATRTGRELYSDCRRKHGNLGPIYVLPNSIELGLWDSVKPPASHDGEVWIGWAGGAAHVGDLEILPPVIDEVLKRCKKARFFWTRVATASLVKLAKKWGERCICVDGWSDVTDWADYYTVLNFDIALGPLLNTHFNCVKSNLKWLEAGVKRQPFVCSNVGPYAESIRNGEDGLLADNPGQWVSHLRHLVESASLRRKIGDAARRRVENEFALEKNARLWADAFEDVAVKCRDIAEKRAERMRYADDLQACVERPADGLSVCQVG